MNTNGIFSSETDEWATPPEVFSELDREFSFTLDPCSTHENAKCENHYTKQEDGLEKSWGGHSVFMNPPYGRQIGKWVQKAFEEAQKENTSVVCLLPARTDTKWFHDYCILGEIRFIRGRLKFGGSKNSAPFPSMVVIFDKKRKKKQ